MNKTPHFCYRCVIHLFALWKECKFLQLIFSSVLRQTAIFTIDVSKVHYGQTLYVHASYWRCVHSFQLLWQTAFHSHVLINSWYVSMKHQILKSAGHISGSEKQRLKVQGNADLEKKKIFLEYLWRLAWAKWGCTTHTFQCSQDFGQDHSIRRSCCSLKLLKLQLFLTRASEYSKESEKYSHYCL